MKSRGINRLYRTLTLRVFWNVYGEPYFKYVYRYALNVRYTVFPLGGSDKSDRVGVFEALHIKRIGMVMSDSVLV